MSEQRTANQRVMGEVIIDEARRSLANWRDDIGDAGPEFQTLHMFATYLLQVVDIVLPKLDGSQRISLLESARVMAQLADAGFDQCFDPDWNEFDGEPKDSRNE